MAVLGEIGRGTTPRFVLKTTCSTGDIEALKLTIKSGTVTLIKTLKALSAYSWYPCTGGATSGHIYIKWLASQPTQDSDMSDTPNQWIGVYAGPLDTAPTACTSYSWYQYGGTEDLGTHIYIKWAAAQPDSNDDLKDTPDAYIGICMDGSAAAPTAYTAYTWYLYKGDTSGTSEYIHIKWLASQPTQDSDMSDTPNAWVGIYAGSSSTAPTAYSDFTWHQYNGKATPKTSVFIKYAEELPTNDDDLEDEYDEYIGIYAGPGTAAPTAITIDGEYQLHIELTQAETLLLSDEITYQYHYRLAAEGGGTDGFTNSSRIYRRTVRELLSGTSI